jgi:HSP20 family protein
LKEAPGKKTKEGGDIMLSIWDPFSSLVRSDRFFESGFPSEWSRWVPRVDIKEEDKEYVVTAEIPGVDPKDVNIELEDGVLSIMGEKKFEKEDKKESYYRMERCYGSFSRSFRLGEDIDDKKIDARYKDGVLTLHLPKKTESKPRSKKIQVKSN